MKKTNIFIVKAIASAQQYPLQTKQVFVYYHVFEISGNSKCGQVPKRGKHKNFIPFYVLLSFLVCINAESKFQTGAALFKTAFKV